jgi:hypothetical protein
MRMVGILVRETWNAAIRKLKLGVHQEMIIGIVISIKSKVEISDKEIIAGF